MIIIAFISSVKNLLASNCLMCVNSKGNIHKKFVQHKVMFYVINTQNCIICEAAIFFFKVFFLDK